VMAERRQSTERQGKGEVGDESVAGPDSVPIERFRELAKRIVIVPKDEVTELERQERSQKNIKKHQA
jgi:hypothetical protein